MHPSYLTHTTNPCFKPSSASCRKHDWMHLNLVTDNVTISLYILLYIILYHVSILSHTFDLFINIYHVLIAAELRTILSVILRRVCLYPTSEPGCYHKVCRWSLFMFAPARLARPPSLFGVFFAPTTVTPVVRGTVVGF